MNGICEDNLEDLTLLLKTYNTHITLPRPYMICHTLFHALRHAHYFTFRLLWHKASCVIVWETHCGSHKTRVKICFWTPLGHDFDTSLRLATPRYARTPQIASLCIKIKTFWGPKTDFHTCLNGNHSLLTILWHNNHFLGQIVLWVRISIKRCFI